MIKKFLVLCDFSAASRNASEYALSLAQATKAEITLLHIYQAPLLFEEKNCCMNQDDLQKAAVEELDLLAGQLRQSGNNKVSVTTEIQAGIFFDELILSCDKLQPYLVVMGSVGNTDDKRLLWGSHTIYAFKHLKFPLLVVPVSAIYHGLKNICFALNEKGIAANIAQKQVKDFCHDLHANLHIFNIHETCMARPVMLQERGRHSNPSSALPPIFHSVASHCYDQAILDFTEKNKIDLLMIDPEKYFLLDILFLSDTRQFIACSNIPVMSLHRYDIFISNLPGNMARKE